MIDKGQRIQAIAITAFGGPDGSKSEELADFRLKSDQAVRRVITGTDIPGKTASHLVSFTEIL